MIYAEVLRYLNENNIKYTVVGMVGAIAQGMDITTSDMDIVVDLTGDNVKKIAQFLNDLSFLPHGLNDRQIDDAIENSKKGIPIVFYDPYTCVTIEMLWEISGFTHNVIFERAKTIEWEGVEMKVLDIEDIAKSKEIAGREKDIAVLPRLRTVIAERKGIQGKKGEIEDGHGARLGR